MKTTNQKPLFGLAKQRVDLVLDVANMAMRAAFSFKELSHRDAPTGHIYGSLTMLMHLINHYSKKYDCRVVFALEGKCEWRKELLPAYKANRGQRVGNASTIKEVCQVFAMLPGLTIMSPDHEADDVIAAHVNSNPQIQQVIYTGDRDLWQLIGLNVNVIKTVREDPVSVYQIDEDFRTTKPVLVPLAKALIGDPSDNIPGVDRFSRDDLRLLLAEIDAPDVDALLEAAEQLHQDGKLKPRTLGLIKDNKDHINKMLRITTLNRVCKYTSITNRPDQLAFQARMYDLGIKSLTDKMDIFFGKRRV